MKGSKDYKERGGLYRRDICKLLGASAVGTTILSTNAAGATRSLDTVMSEEVTLAQRIDSVAENIQQERRTLDAHGKINNKVSAGTVSTSKAIEAVQRRKRALNVTESTIVGWGPASAVFPENSDTLVGFESGTTDYNTAGKTVRLAIDGAVEAALALLSILKLGSEAASAIGSKLDKAKGIMNDLKNFIADVLLGPFDSIAKKVKSKATSVSDDLRGRIKDTGVTAGEEVYNMLLQQTNAFHETISKEIAGSFEEYPPLGTSVSDKLSEVDGKLGGEDGNPTFSGTLSGAKSASENGISDVNNSLSEAKSDLSTLRGAFQVFSLLGAAAAVIAATGVLAIIDAGVALALAGIAVGTAFTGILVMGVTLDQIKKDHNSALSSVVGG